MPRRGLIALAAPALLVAALGWACGSGTGTAGTATMDDPAAELTQTAKAGGVTVDATWLTAAEVGEIDADLSDYPLDRFAAVEIAFTTHSGDLNKIKMEDVAALKVGTGSAKAEAWVTLNDDSHHRQGVAIFERPDGATSAELLLELEDGEKVSLRWSDLPEEAGS